MACELHHCSFAIGSGRSIRLALETVANRVPGFSFDGSGTARMVHDQGKALNPHRAFTVLPAPEGAIGSESPRCSGIKST